jgi:UDP-N-acetyl-D-glucosamine dehydrogenase
MPNWVVEKVSWALNEVRKSVRGSRVLVLGVAYKRDINDVRESPALDVIRLLEERGAHVEYHDPFVHEFREEGHTRKGVELSEEMLRWADAAVIITDHKSIDYQRVVDHATMVIDTRNTTADLKPGRARIVPLASNGTVQGRLNA